MTEIKVGLATCGISAGGELVFDELEKEIKKHDLQIELKKTGCLGMCYEEVLVEVVQNGSNWLYAQVTPDKAKKIIENHILENHPVDEWILADNGSFRDNSFFNKQKRIVLRNCGVIDPGSIDEYIGQGGYKAIQKVLKDYSPDDVIDVITKSGLRGRGGAGFPTGLKWKIAERIPETN